MSRPAMRQREGWRRLSRPGDKCSALWLHEDSGWRVRHCGHPTANYPYYAVDPERPREPVGVHGRGFTSLLEACEGVEHILAVRRRDRVIDELGTVEVGK